MSRTRRRVSRGLIALLIVVLVLGGIFYFHNTSRSAAREQNKPAPPIHVLNGRSPSQTSAQTPTTAPAVASLTPSSQSPATQPAAVPKHDVMVSSTPNLPGSGGASKLVAMDTRSNLTAPPTTGPSKPAMPSFTSQSSQSPAASSTPLDRSPVGLFADGLAKKDAGNLLAARQSLNDALQSGQLSGNDVARSKGALGEINQVIVFSPKRFADDPYGGTYSVQSGDLLKAIAERNDITWELLCRLNNLSDPRKLRAGQTIKLVKGPFHAVVTKHDFTMDLYLGGAPGEKGSMYVMTYPVGLGKDDSTPTGVWMVEPHKKIKNPTYFSPRGEGVIDADDPKNPLGERWIGLTGIDGHAVGKASYGIHGTIEPDSIGKMSSMGCIRMHNEDVEKVFELLVEGKSTVMVKD